MFSALLRMEKCWLETQYHQIQKTSQISQRFQLSSVYKNCLLSISIRKILNGKALQSSGQKISLVVDRVEVALADHAEVALAADEEVLVANSSSFLSKTRL